MEEIVHWQHPKYSAQGWLVIDQLINGVSGGGLFMHPQTTQKEVMELAQAMTMKNSLNTIPFGGAKAGICFDHNHSKARLVLIDFLSFFQDHLINNWSTGGDLNTDSSTIEAIIKSLGIHSSFYALGNMYAKQLAIPNQCQQLMQRVSLPINNYFTLEQSVVGYSLAKLIKQITPKPIRMAIQGFGQIGSSLAYFSEQQRVATIVAISDLSGTIICDTGLSITTFMQIIQKYPHYQTLEQLYPFYQQQFPCRWLTNPGCHHENLCTMLRSVQADVMSFCAARYVITEKIVDILARFTFKNSKYKLIMSGANLPFRTSSVVQKAYDNNMLYLPSWFTSSGNSMLYSQALSTPTVDEYWCMKVLDIISCVLIDKLDSYLSKTTQ